MMLLSWVIQQMDAWFLFVFPDSSISTWHERYLPDPLTRLLRVLLWQDVAHADEILILMVVALWGLAIYQLKAFSRPPPVPIKRLPTRPVVSIIFRPDDPVTTNLYSATTTSETATTTQDTATTTTTTRPMAPDSSIFRRKTQQQQTLSTKPSFVQRIDGMSKRLFGNSTGKSSHEERIHKHHHQQQQNHSTHIPEDVFVETVPDEELERELEACESVDEQDELEEDDMVPPPPPTNMDPSTLRNSIPFAMDLPDSFAPLLSSSHTEISTHALTADLIHAIQCQANVRLRPGRHEVPLDKDSSRPQLVLHVPESTGCRLSAVAIIGSDRLSTQQDLETKISNDFVRSKPMVKHAGLVLDPPLPLANVAPTLIHFPTLFEDRYMIPALRSLQLVRLCMDFIISISSFLEKCLWILESMAQIHLSKVRITPLYKGHSTTTTTPQTHQEQEQTSHSLQEPEWRLQLAFSGHVLLFGWIPVPFISVTLPTFIIPQPHALLDKLISKQPLASARIRRENIAEQRIALAIINTAETWNVDLKLVATPPAVAVDVTLPGGIAIALEMGLWRDYYNINGNNNSNPWNGRNHRESDGAPTPKSTTGMSMATSVGGGFESSLDDGAGSIQSLSSWTTKNESRRQGRYNYTHIPRFDANYLVPWLVEFAAKGTVSHDKMSVHVLKCSAKHEGSANTPNMIPVQKSQFAARGSFAIWKLGREKSNSADAAMAVATSSPLPRRPRRVRRSNSFVHPELETEDSPSVAAILLFPDETASFHNDLRMLQYDYVFDVFEDSKIDAVTLSIGATHPMLNGGTMITTILESIYAFGSMTAREDSVLDPIERRRKRNVLRHLPATDFTFGVQNVFIPTESSSYSDDGQTLFLPEVEGGRMMVRFLGGMDVSDTASVSSAASAVEAVSDGIKLVADFEISSMIMSAESKVGEFPELDIVGVRLETLLSGVIGGSIKAHLRPQHIAGPVSTMGPNVFNPLEAYEIDFSRSSLSVKLKEFSTTLGHRRIMFPAESTFKIYVIESVVDMGFEGKTKCDLSWDFQGLSPILQVTSVGQSPADASPENREQVTLLVSPLRQGCFSLCVSSVGGISIMKAATSREDKEGLYDWKFFNALVSPDEESMGRILDLIHDKRTVDKLLQVVKMINEDLHKMLRYTIKQVWRAKEIFDQEGVSDPGHAIPLYKMARLISLFLTGDVLEVDAILPIARRVVDGDGLDVVKVKDLLQKHLDWYDKWTPELDRAVRWAEVAFGPVSVQQQFVENGVAPLSELPHNAAKFQGIPSANELYETLNDKPQLPLDPLFSNLVGRVAPYLSFKQVEYILQARSSNDWQPNDLRRIRYVYSIKRKVLEIAESYGGLSFLPQSFFLSVFLGEATRTSHRSSYNLSRQVSRKMTRKSSSSSRSGASGTFLQSSRRSNSSTMSRLRRRHVVSKEHTLGLVSEVEETDGQVLKFGRSLESNRNEDAKKPLVPGFVPSPENSDQYELGDSLLGPQDVAILLQAGLTSVMKSSTVVQLNQRMLLDLICSQPRSFALAVLAEIGTSPRLLTSALMALLELDQTVFKEKHRIDMHALIESWLPGIRIPRREDHMAGGRWARHGYYDALYAVSLSIFDDTETYLALKGHLQKVRRTIETDPLPVPREEEMSNGMDFSDFDTEEGASKFMQMVEETVAMISEADHNGKLITEEILRNRTSTKECADYERVMCLYQKAFDACAKLLSVDKHAFHSRWFSEFYKRNYDALMIKSVYDNVIDDVDKVRYWLGALLKGAKKSLGTPHENIDKNQEWLHLPQKALSFPDDIFESPEKSTEQDLVDAIIEVMIYDPSDREKLRADPLVRLLIPNPPGHYDFTIILAAGVVTEGKKGQELKDAFERIEEYRGVKVIRADTATARSFEYNADKIEEAIETAVRLGKPYGLLGYSQGCANLLMAESNLVSGTPKQQAYLSRSQGGLTCRQLLFSAANGSFHGPATDKKMQQLLSMCEDFFKSQAGYFSRAFSFTILEALNSLLDSAAFHKHMGGAQTFLPDGCRAFWRQAQHLSYVPTCTLRGVLEEHTTPECLEMLSHLLTKQSGSSLHDSQVHVFDAVGYPVYHINRNGRVLRRCAVGEAAVQRTHHWSPLDYEVEFVRTKKDIEMASFDCAKDRHVFPWVEVNKRFGFIKMAPQKNENNLMIDAHPLKLLSNKEKNTDSAGK